MTMVTYMSTAQRSEPVTDLTPPPALVRPSGPNGATVEINGYALRQIRTLAGISTAKQLAAQLDVDPSFITRLESGQRTRVGVDVYAGLLRALALDDRRVLLANPHGTAAAEYATHTE